VRHRRMDASPAQVRSSHKIVPAGSLGYRDIEKDSGVIVGTRWAGFGILCRPGPGHRAWCHSFGVFCHSAGRRLDQTARPAVIGQRLPWSRSGFAGPRIHQTVGPDRGVNRANPVTIRPAVLTASRVPRGCLRAGLVVGDGLISIGRPAAARPARICRPEETLLISPAG
jgi:hypothetical protein